MLAPYETKGATADVSYWLFSMCACLGYDILHDFMLYMIHGMLSHLLHDLHCFIACNRITERPCIYSVSFVKSIFLSMGVLDSCLVLFSKIAVDCLSGLEHKSVVMHYIVNTVDLLYVFIALG